jgi:argininosuccinate lyase
MCYTHPHSCPHARTHARTHTQGVPFRETHHLSGAAVRMAEERGVPLSSLTAADLQVRAFRWLVRKLPWQGGNKPKGQRPPTLHEH